MMILMLLRQATLALFAGVGLFFLWRRVAAVNATIHLLVTAGFLIRAIGGVLAYWVSYLRLPIATSLQMGDGFWIFAQDGHAYWVRSATAAMQGPLAILFMERTTPSVFFEQILAVALLLFGLVGSTGILLNLAAYLGSCAMILKLGSSARDRAVIVAIAVLSLTPSAIFWCLQPLKDMFFLFLVAMFFVAAHLWQRLWNGFSGRAVFRSAAIWTLSITALVYAISAIRSYFGVVIVGACIPFTVLTIAYANRRFSATANSLILLPLLVIAVYSGSGPYIPPPLVKADRQNDTMAESLFKWLNGSRAGFDYSGGSTLIGAGHAIRAIDSKLGDKESPKPISRLEEQIQQAEKQQKRSSRHRQHEVAATKPEPAPPSSDSAKVLDRPPISEPKAVLVRESAPVPAAPPVTSSSDRIPKQAGSTEPQQIASADRPPATLPRPAADGSVQPQRVAPKEPQHTTSAAAVESPRTPLPPLSPGASVSKAPQREPPPEQPKSTPMNEPAMKRPKRLDASPVPKASPPIPAPPAAAPAAPARPSEPVAPPVVPVLTPTSFPARLAAGTAALVLPRFVSQHFRILDLRGGRGLWFFAEVDTIVFDAVIVFVFFSVIQALKRRELRAPVFWLILIVTVTVGGGLAYTVSNFGTLFRHRDMVLFGLLLLSVVASVSNEPTNGSARTPGATRPADV